MTCTPISSPDTLSPREHGFSPAMIPSERETSPTRSPFRDMATLENTSAAPGLPRSSAPISLIAHSRCGPFPPLLFFLFVDAREMFWNGFDTQESALVEGQHDHVELEMLLRRRRTRFLNFVGLTASLKEVEDPVVFNYCIFVEKTIETSKLN